MGPAYTAEQIARAQKSGRPLPSVNTGTNTSRRTDTSPARASNVSVDPPSGSYQQLSVGNFMRLSVPTNWRQKSDATGVTFAPDGAFYRGDNGQTGFTHGIQLGTIPDRSNNPQQAMSELLDSLLRSNPQLRRDANGLTREVVGGRQALSTSLRNVSEVTGQPEVVNITTVPLDDENLLYIIAVTPRNELDLYSSTFRRVKQSVQLR